MIGKKETTLEKEKLRMAGLCARSEQCEFDIRVKLDKTVLSSAEKNQIIEFLKNNKFIDDSRFAGSFVRDKVKFAKWGKAKIRFYLAQKRFNPEIINNALEDIDDNLYFEVALNLVKSKVRTLDLNLREDQAKLYRSMMTRGFSGDIIKRCLQIIRNEQRDSEDS